VARVRGSSPEDRKLVRTLFHERLRDPDKLALACVFAGVVMILIPALLTTGFVVPDFEGIARTPLACIAAVGGALAFSFYYSDRSLWNVGVLPGALTGLLVFFGTVLYAGHRETVAHVELAVVFIVCSLPGCALYYFWLRSPAEHGLHEEIESDDGGRGLA
jgi:drug/metabolite transporter (DMT)-like permease